MLTICKNTSRTSGYEVFNNFCLVRDAKKYLIGSLYVSKILNRFTDYNGNIHFVVMPISDHPVSRINFGDAAKICNGTQEGIILLSEHYNCPCELLNIIQAARYNLIDCINDEDKYTQNFIT